MRSQRIEFPGSQGTPLAGRLDLPESSPPAFALFAHCFTCTKDVLAASRIATTLTELGIAVLRFDFTGLGGSGGDFANTNFTSNVAERLLEIAERCPVHWTPHSEVVVRTTLDGGDAALPGGGDTLAGPTGSGAA